MGPGDSFANWCVPCGNNEGPCADKFPFHRFGDRVAIRGGRRSRHLRGGGGASRTEPRSGERQDCLPSLGPSSDVVSQLAQPLRWEYLVGFPIGSHPGAVLKTCVWPVPRSNMCEKHQSIDLSLYVIQGLPLPPGPCYNLSCASTLCSRNERQLHRHPSWASECGCQNKAPFQVGQSRGITNADLASHGRRAAPYRW